MRVGSGVILFQLAGFLTSALADFYFAKHSYFAGLMGTGLFRRFPQPAGAASILIVSIGMTGIHQREREKCSRRLFR